MLINVLVIVLKVFWIEVALFWRDIVTPYRIQNGEYQVQDFLHKERFHNDYGFFVYWCYAAKLYFIFLVTPSVRYLSLHRSFFMLLPLLLVPLTFISNLLLGGIAILSESLMTDSAQGPHRFQCFGKYVLIKLYEGTTVKSSWIFRLKHVKEEHRTHANFPSILTPWVHTYTNFTHAKRVLVTWEYLPSFEREHVRS